MADKAKLKSENNRKPYRGLIEELPVLHYDERANMGLRVSHFCEKLMIYTRSNELSDDLDNIFKAENPGFPIYPEPDEPEPAAGTVGLSELQKIRYTKDYDIYTRKIERLGSDKKRLHGIIIGQLSESSKNQIKTTADGIKALEEEKDPLKLIKAIRATHLTHSLVDPKIAFFAAQSLYELIKMDDRDSLARHKEVLESAHSRLVSAASSAKEVYRDENFDVPSNSMLAVKFIMTLSHKYGAYKQKITRGEKDIPATVKEALEDVQKHGPEYAREVRTHERVNVAKGKSGPGNGDWAKGKPGGNGDFGPRKKLVPGVDGITLEKVKCLYRDCGEFGHMAKMCPMKSTKRAEQMCEDENSIEKP